MQRTCDYKYNNKICKLLKTDAPVATKSKATIFSINNKGVFVKHEQSPILSIFSIKVMAKVTRSLTLQLVSLKGFYYLSMHVKYEVSIFSKGSKVMAKVKCYFFAT